MVEQIKKCHKCRLCHNQEPLLDRERKCQIFWVGLSAKMIISDDEIPLSPETNTGMIIKKIEDKFKKINTYKTNLVKCVPLDEQRKLRYPNKTEIDCCFENLQKEIMQMSPKIVFLLGEKVYSAVGKHLGIKFDKWNDFDFYYKKHNKIYYIPIHHPSYIYVYRRARIEEYVRKIETLINELL